MLFCSCFVEFCWTDFCRSHHSIPWLVFLGKRCWRNSYFTPLQRTERVSVRKSEKVTICQWCWLKNTTMQCVVAGALEKLLVSYGLDEKEESVLWSVFHSVSDLATEIIFLLAYQKTTTFYNCFHHCSISGWEFSLKYFICFTKVFWKFLSCYMALQTFFSPILERNPKLQTCYVFVYWTVNFFSELLVKKSWNGFAKGS